MKVTFVSFPQDLAVYAGDELINVDSDINPILLVESLVGKGCILSSDLIEFDDYGDLVKLDAFPESLNQLLEIMKEGKIDD